MRRFTEREAGPNADQLNDLLAKLPTFPWLKPTPECCDELLAQLVAEHLHALGTYWADPDAFDGIVLKIVQTISDKEAAARVAGSVAWSSAQFAAREAAREAARYNFRTIASSDAWSVAYDGVWAVSNISRSDAASDARHLVSGLPHNPWAPLVEIWALGACPLGIVDNEFVVYVPRSA
jgi:muconolactone delta-isomerase